MDYAMSLIVKLIIYVSYFAPILSKIGLCKYDKWGVGKKIKILLVGYNGARNTGADVRVAVMAKQFKTILGSENIELSILTQDIDNFKVYVDKDVRLIKISTIFFLDVFNACNSSHMVVLCEGSTLKSKFSNALTLFFCQAAGIMKQQDKPCIAYGSEAGYMDSFIEKAVKKHCKKTYFIARTQESLEIIKKLGLSGHLGTDTAWGFDSLSKKSWALNKLFEMGWDGKKEIVGVSLINPFWWPVKASFFRLIKSFITNNWDYHHKMWYYFSTSKQREKKFDEYVSAIVYGISKYSLQRNVHIVAIGMEALDIKACNRFLNLYDKSISIISSIDYDGYEIKEFLGNLSVLITSRYHARILSLESNVPAIAVSMDERLENIFKEIGQFENYYFDVEDKELGENLYKALMNINKDRTTIKEDLKIASSSYNSKLNDMGRFFDNYIENKFGKNWRSNSG